MKNIIVARIIFLIAFIGSYGARAAHAHDFVLIPDNAHEMTLRFGHPGEYTAPDPDRLIQLNGYFADSAQPVSLLSRVTKRNAAETKIDLTSVAQHGGLRIVSGEYDNGYWGTVDGKKFWNTSKIHLANEKDGGTFFKFAKALYPAAGGTGGFDRKLGAQLEIVPTTDPFKVQPGQKLPVEVTYMDKPLTDIGVEVGDGVTKMKEEEIPRYKTDSRGIAMVPISKPGLQIVAVDYRTAPRYPELSDHDDYGASLVFFVGKDAR